MEKLSVSELKEKVKGVGLVSSGDKGTLIHRLKLYQSCEDKGILLNGQNPCTLKIGDLKKETAKAGLSPIGSQDELVTALVEHLVKSAVPSIASSDRGADGAMIAQRILELEDLADDEAIINVMEDSFGHLSKASPLAELRKRYLKLSLLIHPDKIGRSFPQATKAFQTLVQAFERLSTQETAEEAAKSKVRVSKKREMAISRSNEGCYRTRVRCPRCKEPWNETCIEGNPDYFYNLMMMGLKRFTCATCLCEFGSLTGTHECPHCHRAFDYTPAMYHEHVRCSHGSCGKSFGFMMYHASPRVMDDLKDELRRELDARNRLRESRLRRAGRVQRNSTSLSSNEHEEVEEQAFLQGLVDVCPRCGEEVDYSDTRDKHNTFALHADHLRVCTDARKHQRYRASKQAAEARRRRREALEDLQDQYQAEAVVQYLGSGTEELWLLTDKQLREHAHRLGITDASSGDTLALLQTLVDRAPPARTVSVPADIGRRSRQQLLAFCVTHGISVHGQPSKTDLIDLIQEHAEEGGSKRKRLSMD